MGLIDPANPLYNTIVFYIIIVVVLLISKPEFMYCDKTKRFKTFGIGKNQSILSFPVMCFASVILLYFIFLSIDILNNCLETREAQK